MRPACSAAQAISLRGTSSGAFGIHRPVLAARGAGLSKTCWVAASAGLSARPASRDSPPRVIHGRPSLLPLERSDKLNLRDQRRAAGR